MKRLVYLASLAFWALCSYQCSSEQEYPFENIIKSGVFFDNEPLMLKPYQRLEWVNDTLYIVSKYERFRVNTSVISVKLKPGELIDEDLTVILSDQHRHVNIEVPENIDIETFALMLKQRNKFEVIQYCCYGKFCFTPNDTQIGFQWYLERINAYSAWDITTGSPSIKVAIIDTGTNWQHPDIGFGTDGYSNIDPSLGWDYVRNSSSSTSFFFDFHGTMVAGIVGAKTNNTLGVAGVAGGNGSSGVTLIPYCVGDHPNIEEQLVHFAIYNAVDAGARIIQLSMSINSNYLLENAIDYALGNNVVVVCSSGNFPHIHPSGVGFPASHPGVIAVGSISQSNNRSSHSRYGSGLSVVAPGDGIWSTSTLQNEYYSDSGTSFAAPQVSGIAALMLSVNPNLLQWQVRQIIESTCTKINSSTYTYSSIPIYPNGTWNEHVGYGLVNAYAAVVRAAGGHKVAFDVNGGYTIQPQDQYIMPNAYASAPDNPLRLGYTFSGWSTTPNGNPINFATYQITHDQTLYAKWVYIPPAYCVVTYAIYNYSSKDVQTTFRLEGKLNGQDVLLFQQYVDFTVWNIHTGWNNEVYGTHTLSAPLGVDITDLVLKVFDGTVKDPRTNTLATVEIQAQNAGWPASVFYYNGASANSSITPDFTTYPGNSPPFLIYIH